MNEDTNLNLDRYEFVTKRAICEFLKISPDTIKRYRLQGVLIEGIHWVRVGGRKLVRYNLPLLRDWVHNQGDPAAHQRAIANYQATLLSNQNNKVGRGSLCRKKH